MTHDYKRNGTTTLFAALTFRKEHVSIAQTEALYLRGRDLDLFDRS
jgi:hypothetical protein